MTSPREKVERDDAERLSGYLSCAGCGWKKHFSSGSHISEQRLLHQVGGRRKGRKQGPIRTLSGSEALVRAIWPLSPSLKPAGRKDSSFSQPALSWCSPSYSLNQVGVERQSLHHPLNH